MVGYGRRAPVFQVVRHGHQPSGPERFKELSKLSLATLLSCSLSVSSIVQADASRALLQSDLDQLEAQDRKKKLSAHGQTEAVSWTDSGQAP